MKEITASNIIAVNRLDRFIKRVLDSLEKTDKEYSISLKRIKARTRRHEIELSNGAEQEIVIMIAQYVYDIIKPCIKIIDIKGKATLTKEVLADAIKLKMVK